MFLGETIEADVFVPTPGIEPIDCFLLKRRKQ